MSRLGKRQIVIPSGVKVELCGGSVVVQGEKGNLTHTFSADIDIEINDGKISLKGNFDRSAVRTQAGLTFALLKNMLKGVTEGYTKELQIIGVGYRAQIQEGSLNLQLGFSHPVVLSIPEGIKIQIPKPTQIIIQGIDKARVGNISAQIRAIYPPEPYKGKGIRYKGEYVRKKLGKAVTK
jgi:large subunit ribosomal protein L6